jgi:hypothetical protein
VRAFGRIQRAELGETPGRDQHAARVHADVAHQALQLLRQREELAHLVLVLLALGEQRLHLARVAERDALPGLHRHELGELVAEAVRQVEHAPAVAQHRARRQGAEGGDLGNAFLAVLGSHIIDDPVAAVLAEIDVEVRHRHALGVEEALEQQVVFQRVEISDAERVRDERPRPRAASRPDRHAV